jgi:hypothetical protein
MTRWRSALKRYPYCDSDASVHAYWYFRDLRLRHWAGIRVYESAAFDESFVQAMYLLTNAFDYAIGEAFVLLVGDPQIIWLFVELCIGSFCVGCIFWLFRKYDNRENEVNALDAKHD